MPRVPDDAPGITQLEKIRIERKARAAAEEAQARKAMGYLPFPELPMAQRLVATWLSMLSDLFKFYDSQVKRGSQSVHIYRVRRGSEVTVGTCYGRTFDEFVRGLTNAFCGDRETDEIEELIAIKWILRIPARPQAYQQSQSWREKRRKDPNEYINDAQRGGRKETPEQVAIKAAEKQGGKAAKKCKEVYDEVFERTWQEEEDRIRSGPMRNKRLTARDQRREERRSKRKK